MERLSRQLGMQPVEIGPAVEAGLKAYGWPGNVRELRNLVERTLILGRFPAEFQMEMSDVDALDDAMLLGTLEKQHILNMLGECNGNRAEAARRLGISRKTIDRKLSAWTSHL